MTAPLKDFDIDDAMLADDNLKEFAKLLEQLDGPLAAVLSLRLIDLARGAAVKNSDVWAQLLKAAEQKP